MKKNKKEELYKEVKELRYNKDLSIKELAQYYRKSERTIYRWLQKGREHKKEENKQATDRNLQRNKEHDLENIRKKFSAE